MSSPLLTPEFRTPYAAAALRPEISVEIARAYETEQPLWGWLNRKGCVKTNVSGKVVQKQYKTAETSDFKTTAPWTVLERSLLTSLVQAEWDYGAFSAQTMFEGMEMSYLQNSGNGTVRTAAQLVAANLNNLKVDIFKRFGPQLWSGDGTAVSNGTGPGILGLLQAIVAANTTGTYAGLSRATYSFWRPQYQAATSGLTGDPYTDARYLYRKMRWDCTRKNPFGRSSPDGLFCDRDAITFAQEALEASQTNVNVMDAGKTMSAMGLEFMMDEDLSSGQNVMLNSSTIVVETPNSTVFEFFESKGTDPNIHPRTTFHSVWAQVRARVLYPRCNGLMDGMTA